MNQTKMNPWMPMTSALDLKVIGKLGEELGEGSAAVARCIIQGVMECEPVTGKRNIDWLSEEIADVQANIDLVVERFGLDQVAIAARRERKKAALREWHGMLPKAEPEEQACASQAWTAERWLFEIKTAADFSPCIPSGVWDRGLHNMIATAARKLADGKQAQQLLQDQVTHGMSITRGGERIDPADVRQDDVPADPRPHFRAYLAECDECAIQPDVAGAFNGGWQAGLKAGSGNPPVAPFEFKRPDDSEGGLA